MGITSKQRAKRRQYMGASDMAAVCGLDPYRSAYDVWADKCGMLAEEDEAPKAAQVGTLMEDGILAYAAEELGGVKLRRNVWRVEPEKKILACHLDAMPANGGGAYAIEAKLTSISSEWGGANSNDVPERVRIQCLAQMACAPELERVVVAAMIGGRRPLIPQLYDIWRDNGVIAELREEAERFWREHVKARVAPPDVPSDSTLQRMVREEEGPVVDLDHSLLEAYQAASETERLADNAKKTARNLLLAALGASNVGRTDLGWTVSYPLHSRRGYTVEPSTYRKISVRKPPRSKKK